MLPMRYNTLNTILYVFSPPSVSMSIQPMVSNIVVWIITMSSVVPMSQTTIVSTVVTQTSVVTWSVHFRHYRVMTVGIIGVVSITVTWTISKTVNASLCCFLFCHFLLCTAGQDSKRNNKQSLQNNSSIKAFALEKCMCVNVPFSFYFNYSLVIRISVNLYNQ